MVSTTSTNTLAVLAPVDECAADSGAGLVWTGITNLRWALFNLLEFLVLFLPFYYADVRTLLAGFKIIFLLTDICTATKFYTFLSNLVEEVPGCNQNSKTLSCTI